LLSDKPWQMYEIIRNTGAKNFSNMSLPFVLVFITLFFSQFQASANKIREAKFVTLGSIEQWITINELHGTIVLVLVN
jgi:hypothetical protein